MPDNKQEYELLEALAQLYVGLQVPISLGMPLGVAREAYDKITDLLHLSGWTSEVEAIDAIADGLGV